MNFITRIELHNATYDNYNQLHRAMENQNFSRLIKSDNGIVYHLPEAEYSCSSSSIDGVLSAAKIAANSTGCKYLVFTCEWKQWKSEGLIQA